MNKQEEAYFKALFRDRSDSADTLEKPSMRSIKHSVVEKYSGQAHFIYELLQNADDAKATSARFVLEPGRLIFDDDDQLILFLPVNDVSGYTVMHPDLLKN